ncbi:hypothetical protein CEXT_715571 [Caerostris extrusa]|uniref:Uncharacterized protein n=1 Tax=Caerostris extrusa TaxID=172846 RepID=A0AAV4M5P0_CAEEX|nr:hypothetical protein CEXT_715571 [Caerostris extrusa]
MSAKEEKSGLEPQGTHAFNSSGKYCYQSLRRLNILDQPPVGTVELKDTYSAGILKNLTVAHIPNVNRTLSSCTLTNLRTVTDPRTGLITYKA